MSAIFVNDRMNINNINIPAVFFTEHMPRANGEYVKVYLFLLYMVQTNRSISMSMLAETLEDTEKDVMRALRYWQKHDVVKLTFDGEHTLTSIELLPLQREEQAGGVSEVSQQLTGGNLGEPKEENRGALAGKRTEESEAQTQTVSASGPAPAAFPEGGDYQPVFANHASLEELTGNAEFVELMFVIQQYKGSPLSSTELQKIAFFYNIFGHFDVVEYLFEYCISNNHRQMRYIEKTALNWHKEGIRTRKDAEDSHRRKRNADYARQVMERFGLKNDPAPLQDNFIRKWRDTYHFNIDMVLLACDKTIKRCGGHNFEYADRVLSGWYEEKLFTPADVANHEKERQARKQAEEATKAAAAAASGTGTAAGTGAAKAAAEGQSNSVHTTPARKNAFHNFPQRDYSNVDLDSIVFGTTSGQ